MAQPNNALPLVHLPHIIAGPPLPIPNFANMAQQALDVSHNLALSSETLGELSENQQALSNSFNNLAGEIALIQNIPAVANVDIQAQILQALHALTNSVNQGNQRLNAMQLTMNNRFNDVNARFDAVNVRFNGVNARFDAVNVRFNGIDQSIQRMREDLVWEQDTAYKRTMNATAGSGPYEVISRNPRVPAQVQYDEGIFPVDIEQISRLTNQKCHSLAAAWGLDITDCENVKERKRRVAHFIGVHFNV